VTENLSGPRLRLFPRLVACAVGLLQALAPLAGASAGGSLPNITGFSPGSGLPFAVLTIEGKELNPKAQFTVTFSDGQGFLVKEPGLLANKHEIHVSLPPYFDKNGNLTDGTLSIQLTEAPNSGTTSSSNILSGLKIEAPPTTSLPAGTFLLALLQATLSADTDLQTSLAGVPDVLNGLTAQVTDLKGLIANVQSVINGRTSGFVIATHNGANVMVDRNALATSDRLVLSLLEQLAQPSPQSPAGSYLVAGLDAAKAGSNRVQAAAMAALNATNSAEVASAMQNLVQAIESFTRAHPYTGFVVLLGGATLAMLGIVAYVGTPFLPALVLAGWLQGYIGLSLLFAPVALFSYEGVSAAAPTVLKVACAALDGTKAGIVKVKDEFTGGITDQFKSELSSDISKLNDALELVKCGKRIFSRPKVSVVNHAVTGMRPAGCTPPPPVSVFHSSAAEVDYWIVLSNLRPGNTLLWNWYKPDGTLYLSDQTNISVNGQFCLWDTMFIAGFVPSSTPGTWIVRALYNNKTVVSDSFDIVGSGTGQCIGDGGSNACGPCNTNADCPGSVGGCWHNNQPAPFCTSPLH
jgi:hypothetical protein